MTASIVQSPKRTGLFANSFSRTLAALGLVLAVLGTAWLGAWGPADAKLWEARFTAASRAPSGEVVFVDIDSASLEEIGVWPWPRSLHGRLLDQLMAMGAYEVALDIDFGTQSSTKEDAALAAALERAGGYAYLAAFQQVTAEGEAFWSRPIALFEQFAIPALVNVDSLESGMVWSLPGQDFSQGLHSIAALFNPGKAVPESLHIDYGIDLTQIVRIPASDVLAGRVDASLIRDRQVVVGASAIELHDLLLVPRFGVVPGPMVHIAAVETVKQGRIVTDLGLLPAVLLSLSFVLRSLLLPRMKLPTALRIVIITALGFEEIATLLYFTSAVQMDTVPFHVLVASMMVAWLLEERVHRRHLVREQYARLGYLASHDVATGARAPAAWCDAVAERAAAGQDLDILLMRLEHLDGAGASLGYEVTDGVFLQFVDRLQRAGIEPIGRIETRIFVVALPAPLDRRQRDTLLGKLCAPYNVVGHRVLINLRWGQSRLEARGSAPVALQRAGTALTMAMHENSGGLIYKPEFDAAINYRRKLDLALREAVERDELDVAFQLQVETTTRAATGAEALLRWASKEFGVVSPGEFIPLAEENGTIVDLGAFVAMEACRRAVALGWAGRLSINVSPVQVEMSDVVAMISDVLEKTGFPAERMDVEITESLVAGGGPKIIETLEGLRALGVAIAIDDFGTGHSSLSQLANLPVDKLKIDQSFVRQLGSARGLEAMETIAHLGHRLNLSIVVEGVETEAEFEIVKALGCQTIQGYLFGRPGTLPRNDEAARLASVA